ncbi:MAG TPA: carboxypeptidase regulatory-like domain-containing protein [Kofleriaceae bacterium]|nr:carboxypeptidase regulatory-like domain-containing protein [Kofleriaceae bacterium]
MTRRLLVSLWIGVCLATPAAADGPTTGIIRGEVRDAATGEPLPGATLVATSPALTGEQAVITDELGEFQFTGLPPGTYQVTAYYSDVTVERSGVVVAAGTTAQVNLKIDTSKSGGELILITDKAPAVDSSADRLGVTFSGSTSLESSYVADGASGDPRQQRAGRLTATTVPDADRYDAYVDFLGRHREEWEVDHLIMDRRLRVRVVDQDGDPVNDAVIRVDGGRYGRTHADGVWDHFPGVDAGAGATVRLEVFGFPGGQRVIRSEGTVALAAHGDSQITVRLPLRAELPRALDLAFAIDVTGSMGDEMTYLQSELLDVIARIRAAVPGVSIRVGAVAYRDRGDTVPLACRDLDGDVDAFMAWLATLRADGGGDYPEDVEAAMAAAMGQLTWREGNVDRVLVLLGDAPPQRYQDAAYRMVDGARAARARGIRILPVAASGADRSVEYLFRALGAYTSTPYVYLTDDSGIGEDHLEADTDRIDVEHFNDLLVRLVVSDLRGDGMHAPGDWRAWNDYRSPPWRGKPLRLVAGLGTGMALLASHTDAVAMHWARAGIAFGDLELRVQLGWSPELDGEPRRLARSPGGETPPAEASRGLGLVPGVGVRYLFGPWTHLRAFTGAGLEAQFLRAHPGAGVATLFSSQAGLELRSRSTAGPAAGVQLGGHVMLGGHHDLATPRPHLDLTIYAEQRF